MNHIAHSTHSKSHIGYLCEIYVPMFVVKKGCHKRIGNIFKLYVE